MDNLRPIIRFLAGRLGAYLLAVAIAYVAESCETEITTMCRDVPVGEGRILACLEENDAKLGESCKTAITETAAE